MSQITHAFHTTSHSERMFRWQVAINAAFAGGSLAAAFMNIGALVALSIARSALAHVLPYPSKELRLD